MMRIKWIFVGIVVLLAGQRLWELRLSRRNEARIRAAGGKEFAAWQVQAMKVLHTAWFFSMIGEVFVLDRPFVPAVSAIAFVLLVAGQCLRYVAIQTLSWRWSVRILVLPEIPRVNHGIYRYLRHPNYLGVVLEMMAVPLLHSAYTTAILFSVANGILLILRIRAEERALSMSVRVRGEGKI